MKKFALALVLAFPAFADEAPPPPMSPEMQQAMLHPEGIEKVGIGVIEGGWSFVYAAYGVALAGVAFYAASLFLRRKGAA
jgi:hypothetical protein